MKIVVLDGYTLNPGDLDWDGLSELGEVAVYDRSSLDETLQRASDADVVLTNKTVLSREILEQLPKLRYVGVLATGFNVVDIEAARELDIVVTNVPGYGVPSVAQMVFAHILNFAQSVDAHGSSVRNGEWAKCEDFCYWKFPLFELQGKVLGLIGFGQIGQAVAKLGLAFGMRVLVYNRSLKPMSGVSFVDRETVLRESDVISLHCPLTDETRHLVNEVSLSQMKPTAYLINTGRGDLVDEIALANALNGGNIAGAGLDVLSSEPPTVENPLIGAKNCVITPHIAWATSEARKRLMAVAVSNVRAFLEGIVQNQVH